jgi:steroid 5-alpha reductase family enzyme
MMKQLVLSSLLLLATADVGLALRPRDPAGSQSPPKRPPLRPSEVGRRLDTALRGRAALPTIAAVATVPCLLGLINQAFAFTYSYGLAIGLVGLILLLSSPQGEAAPSWMASAHASLLIAYGVRLFTFLVRRRLSWPRWAKVIGEMSNGKTIPLSKRLVFVVSIGLFYALLCAPALFHRQVHSHSPLTGCGLAIAALGLMLEAAADVQKSAFKRANGADAPIMTGLYARVRHPNYLGEVIFWTGSFLAGLPSIIQTARVGSVASMLYKFSTSALGVVGIVGVMSGASKRLDGKQRQKYGSLPAYEAYRERSVELFG